jgi:hypothetical protein
LFARGKLCSGHGRSHGKEGKDEEGLHGGLC